MRASRLAPSQFKALGGWLPPLMAVVGPDMSEHIFHLIGGGDDETATVVAEPRNGLCHLTLRYRGREIEASARDYFEAFCQVREHLEAERLIPFCYGASLHVFPSGMC